MDDLIKLMITRKAAAFIALCIAISGVCLSIIFQYSGDFMPCKLCLIQRCLLGGAAISLMVMHLKWCDEKLKSIFFWGSVLLMLCVAGVSFYQILVQYEIVAEPSFCIKNDISDKTVEEILDQINNTYTSNCKSFGPTIFGIPLSILSCSGALFASLYLVFAKKH